MAIANSNESKSGKIFANLMNPWKKAKLTIYAPLILKMRDIIFIAGNVHNGPFQGRGSKNSRPPRNIPRNGPLCSLQYVEPTVIQSSDRGR